MTNPNKLAKDIAALLVADPVMAAKLKNYIKLQAMQELFEITFDNSDAEATLSEAEDSQLIAQLVENAESRGEDTADVLKLVTEKLYAA